MIVLISKTNDINTIWTKHVFHYSYDINERGKKTNLVNINQLLTSEAGFQGSREAQQTRHGIDGLKEQEKNDNYSCVHLSLPKGKYNSV